MIMKICNNCSNQFLVDPYRQDIAKFCTKRCYHVFSKGKRNNTGRTHFKKGQLVGEKSYQWRGNEAKYRARHSWVQNQLGKARRCSNDSSHISTCYHWANISGEYKRELSDWRELCPNCNHSDGVRIPKILYERRTHI